MIDNEMLILVYETLQKLSGSVKDTKSAVSAINSKIETINKHVSELNNIVNDVVNPGIMTIGEGHETVHKTLYDTLSGIRKDMDETKAYLADELKSAQDMLTDNFRAVKDALNSELKEARSMMRDDLTDTQDVLDTTVKNLRKTLFDDMAAMRSKIESGYTSSQDQFRDEILRGQEKLESDTKAFINKTEALLDDVRKTHSDLSARFEVYELKQQRIEQELKTIKRLR